MITNDYSIIPFNIEKKLLSNVLSFRNNRLGDFKFSTEILEELNIDIVQSIENEINIIPEAIELVISEFTVFTLNRDIQQYNPFDITINNKYILPFGVPVLSTIGNYQILGDKLPLYPNIKNYHWRFDYSRNYVKNVNNNYQYGTNSMVSLYIPGSTGKVTITTLVQKSIDTYTRYYGYHREDNGDIGSYYGSIADNFIYDNNINAIGADNSLILLDRLNDYMGLAAFAQLVGDQLQYGYRTFVFDSTTNKIKITSNSIAGTFSASVSGIGYNIRNVFSRVKNYFIAGKKLVIGGLQNFYYIINFSDVDKAIKDEQVLQGREWGLDIIPNPPGVAKKEGILKISYYKNSVNYLLTSLDNNPQPYRIVKQDYGLDITEIIKLQDILDPINGVVTEFGISGENEDDEEFIMIVASSPNWEALPLDSEVEYIAYKISSTEIETKSLFKAKGVNTLHLSTYPFKRFFNYYVFATDEKLYFFNVQTFKLDSYDVDRDLFFYENNIVSVFIEPDSGRLITGTFWSSDLVGVTSKCQTFHYYNQVIENNSMLYSLTQTFGTDVVFPISSVNNNLNLTLRLLDNNPLIDAEIIKYVLKGYIRYLSKPRAINEIKAIDEAGSKKVRPKKFIKSSRDVGTAEEVLGYVGEDFTVNDFLNIYNV